MKKKRGLRIRIGSLLVVPVEVDGPISFYFCDIIRI